MDRYDALALGFLIVGGFLAGAGWTTGTWLATRLLDWYALEWLVPGT